MIGEGHLRQPHQLQEAPRTALHSLLPGALLDVAKGAAASAAGFIGLIAGGLVTRALGLPTPASPPQAQMAVLMPLVFVSGIAVAIVLGECFRQVGGRFWPRALATWLCTYLLNHLVNTLDGLLFSPLPNLSTSIVSDVFPALLMALAVTGLWRPGPEAAPRPLREYLAAWRPASLTWRLAAAWLVFPVIYYAVGRLVAPLVLPFYAEPSHSLGLVLPDTGTMLAMQVLRGALFLIGVLPILVARRGSPSSTWLWVGAVIFIQVAVGPVLQGHWLPWAVRGPHALELLTDSLLQALVYVRLLAIRDRARA